MFALLILFFYIENNFIVVSKVAFSSKGLVDENIRILHLSDLHAKRIENVFISFKKKVKKLKPDLIFITGDIISDNKSKSLDYVEYLKEAFGEIPVYYVNGNHEAADYSFLKTFTDRMSKAGFVLLDGKSAILNIKSNQIRVSGLKDPNFYEASDDELIKERIEELEGPSEIFDILLTHRAEHTLIYNDSNFDLILCGHAHGGIIGIPFTKGNLYSRGEGFFPKYTKGLHQKTYISRGLGGSRFITRLFNHPEMSMITIEP